MKKPQQMTFFYELNGRQLNTKPFLNRLVFKVQKKEQEKVRSIELCGQKESHKQQQKFNK